MPIRPKQSPKQAFSNAAGGTLRSAKPFLIIGGLLWGAASVAFNGFGSKANGYAEYGTQARSELAYLDKKGGQVANITISMRNITDIKDEDKKLYLTADAYEKVKRMRSEYTSVTTPWTGKVNPLIEEVGSQGNSGFTWTFNNFSFTFERDGAQLMQIADRYKLAIMPSDGELPEMTITKKEGKYSTVITLPDTMSQADNIKTLRLLLNFVKNSDKLKPNMSGTYKVERRPDSGELFIPAAEPPVAPPAFAAVQPVADTAVAAPAGKADDVTQLRQEVDALRKQLQALSPKP